LDGHVEYLLARIRLADNCWNPCTYVTGNFVNKKTMYVCPKDVQEPCPESNHAVNISKEYKLKGRDEYQNVHGFSQSLSKQ
jgi:hypothetical protein